MQEKQLSIESLHLIQAIHEEIRHTLETELEDAWRITKIEEVSQSNYGITLLTQGDPHPTYICTLVLAEFEIHAVRDGPLVFPSPGDTLYCKAQLVSNGKLYFPTKWEIS